MGIHVALEHHTTYRFDRTTQLYPHVLRLRPAPHSRTPIVSYSLDIGPEEHFLNWQQDPFGNYLARLVFPEPVTELSINVDIVADMTIINPFDFFVGEDAEVFPFEYDPALRRDLARYLEPATADDPVFDAWLSGIDRTPRRSIEFLVDLNARIRDDVGYSVRMEPGVQTPTKTLQSAIGSCRDSGWLLVEALRRCGLAARFVSGYLVQLASDQESLDGPDGPEEDFTDLHAWAEVYLPGAGWVGLDPTSGLFVGEGHIPLACTPHPSTAAPVEGTTSKTEVEFEFHNRVTRIREDPRVTKPYSAEQWEEIDRLGHEVDERLLDRDVRLTMGGEPTFVSIDDMDGDEWNITADSTEKRRLAAALAGRLRDRFGPGGVLQHGQGKWYPGEPLPRWQIDIVWRHDGEPLWNDQHRLADPATEGTIGHDDLELFALAVAERLGIDDGALHAAWEDPVDEAWREARLPAGEPPALDVSSDELDDLDSGDPERAADARLRLIERLRSTTGRPAGWVLPVRHREVGGGWETTEWHLRRGRLFLTPGDSPVGLRLPLDSLTWGRFPDTIERDPFADTDPLPIRQHPADGRGDAVEPPVDPPADDIFPTALAFERRNGHVGVFLPPLDDAEHAIELLDALEAVAAEHDTSVVLEGYPLPRDHRLGSLTVTPDPGVIEVNVQPAETWDELTDITETLYEEARQTRLGTEKFNLDGTHTGTGGGNHVTLGGVTPSDSPLLRRPDLLASMVRYWQHHPSLSYLFSGQFIGPTSQAPRVDEGRPDTPYELEVAFAELDRLGAESADEPAPAWRVDRALRNFLVDLTGNTHRAEFSIDKLYSPDSTRGRLGLLELRAFEMPPHPQMALVQSLMVRSLVTRFWDDPYQGDLVRWGTDLYDRFLLPWYVESDINDVVADLNDHEIDFEPTWLEPFLEFRFPLVGERTIRDVRLELRRAIEPWHVLGEEVSGSGTSRYVDSSVERLQLRVDGFNPERHIVTCNGHAVPLQPTEVPGTGVAGVRFKAWSPWSALHPSIDVHGPLTFDLVDRWSQRSLGGCSYHVSHPGGLGYDSFPVNAAEAESRRQNRFTHLSHHVGAIDIDELDLELATRRADYPRTLDLRRAAR